MPNWAKQPIKLDAAVDEVRVLEVEEEERESKVSVIKEEVESKS